MPIKFKRTPTVTLFRIIVAAWIRLVRFLTNRRAKRRVAQVQKIDPNDTAMPDPAKTKLGKLETIVAVGADDALARNNTFRAKMSVTDATVVKIT